MALGEHRAVEGSVFRAEHVEGTFGMVEVDQRLGVAAELDRDRDGTVERLEEIIGRSRRLTFRRSSQL